MDYQLPEQQWVHLAAVKRGPEVIVYLDGKPAATGTMPADLPALPLYLGGDPQAGELSTCDLADVRLYAKALSPEQIARQAEGSDETPEVEASGRVWAEAIRRMKAQ